MNVLVIGPDCGVAAEYILGQGGRCLRQRIYKFFLYFWVLFIGNLVINAVFKQDLNVLTAFSVALGVSWGIFYFGPYVYGKFSKV